MRGMTMDDAVWTEADGGHGRATLNGLDLATGRETRFDGLTPRCTWIATRDGWAVALGYASTEEDARRVAAEYAKDHAAGKAPEHHKA